MEDLVSESVLRLACFAGVLLFTGLAESLAPRRRLSISKPLRWLNNLGLVCLNTLVARFMLPMGAVGMAWLAQSHGWGLFNNLAIPSWLAVVLTIVLLDFAVYLQHVLFHAVPVLWRLHMVHHADLDMDASTGLRFHTIEILISLSLKLAIVSLLGAPPLGVLLFEVILNAAALFNHSNLCLPRWLDAMLRMIIVTPDMHRVHHSANTIETNSNFGFNLPWWDFLLGTYRAQPERGHDDMIVGLAELRDEARAESLPWMLVLPFLVKTVDDHDGKPDRTPSATATAPPNR